MQATTLKERHGYEKRPIGPVDNDGDGSRPGDRLEPQDKLRELIALEGPRKPRETKPGFNWVAANHGQPLPKDTSLEDFVCGGCKLCLVATIELLAPTSDKDDPGRARITVELVDPASGAVKETFLKQVVVADDPDGITDRELTAELSCGETDYLTITIGYGALYEKPPGGADDQGAGSVRIEIRAVQRGRAR